MLHIEMSLPGGLTDGVLEVVDATVGVSAVAVLRGASRVPPGDLVSVDVAREAADVLIHALYELGVGEQGTLRVEEVEAFVSRAGLIAERRAPGLSSDAVVWAQVVNRSYSESELNITYLAFMTLATILAAIAIILDSQILTIGAMVLGPEFGAIAALGVALTLHRWLLLRYAARTLVVGFLVAIVVTFGLSLLVRALGWVAVGQLGHQKETAFIYSPDRWSFVVAVVAAVAGVLSITSAKTGGMAGVFISVTTIPAAGNISLAAAFAQWGEVRGSTVQLAVNLGGMAVAGWVTLLGRRRWSDHAARRSVEAPGEPM